MSRTTNFSEQEKLLLAELGKDFPEVESKGYDSKALAKKAKAWEEILTRFNSQIPNGIKRDLSQLQGCWKRLKLQSKKRAWLTSSRSKKNWWRKSSCLPKWSKEISSRRSPSLRQSSGAGIWWWCRRTTWFKARQRRQGSYYILSGAKCTCWPWRYWQERSGQSHEKGG